MRDWSQDNEGATGLAEVPGQLPTWEGFLLAGICIAVSPGLLPCPWWVQLCPGKGLLLGRGEWVSQRDKEKNMMPSLNR